MQLLVIAFLVACAVSAVGLLFVRQHRTRASDIPGTQDLDADEQGDDSPTPVEYTTAAIRDIHDECFKLAFGVPRFDYRILGEHAIVFERASAALKGFVPEQGYFPRRPMLLPRLLQMLNDNERDRRALTQMVMQDPTLAGSVLQRANTAYYRTSEHPIESVDRALAVLGTEGLRAILATVILQPLFRLPPGFFDQFASVTWDQGQRAGFAAQAIARPSGGDPLVAQLLALIFALSRVVLFRFTSDHYRQMPEVLPRAEVFIRLMQRHGAQLCHTIAAQWELSTASLAALREQADECSPAYMSPPGRTLYFGELCGALAVTVAAGRYSEEGAQAILREQGLGGDLVAAAWQAAKGRGVVPQSR